MKISIRDLPSLIMAVRIMIENTLAIPEISAAVAKYGYDTTKILEGKELLEETIELIHEHQKQLRRQFNATADLNQARTEFHQSYMQTLKVARVALQASTKAHASLKLDARRYRTFTEWFYQADTFYEALLVQPDLCAEMAKFGYSNEKLTAEAALLQEVETRSHYQKKQLGLSDETLQLRNEKLQELKRWVSNYRAIVRVALADTPQKMEALGIMVRS